MLTVDSKPVCVCVRDWQNLVSNATPWRMVIQIDTRVKALTIHNEPWSFTPHKLNLIKRTLESHVSIHTTTTTNWIPPCDRVQKGKKKKIKSNIWNCQWKENHWLKNYTTSVGWKRQHHREWGYSRGTIQETKSRKCTLLRDGSKLTHICVEQEEICASTKCSKEEKKKHTREWVTCRQKKQWVILLKRFLMNPKSKVFF